MERASRDIILVHLVPLLGEKDIRSLAATCKALANVFSCIRHQTVDVRKNRGYFRRHLSRSTVRNISHLILNGTDTDNYDLFQCCDLRNMKRVTIVTRIADRHRFEFSQWAQQLTDITEERDHNDKTGPPDGSSSLSNLPACTLTKMERLRLDISIPRGFQTLLNVATNLRHLEFIPTLKPMEEEDLIEYIDDFETLVLMLRDRESLPNLKLVHVIAAMSISKQERRICENMIALSFTAAYQHGGWKLVSGHPCRGFRRDMTAGAWEYYWNEMSWDFFMTIKAFRCFVYDCSRWGLYPRITDFVEGRVHIQAGQGGAKVGLMETEVYGVGSARPVNRLRGRSRGRNKPHQGDFRRFCGPLGIDYQCSSGLRTLPQGRRSTGQSPTPTLFVPNGFRWRKPQRWTGEVCTGLAVVVVGKSLSTCLGLPKAVRNRCAMLRSLWAPRRGIRNVLVGENQNTKSFDGHMLGHLRKLPPGTGS